MTKDEADIFSTSDSCVLRPVEDAWWTAIDHRIWLTRRRELPKANVPRKVTTTVNSFRCCRFLLWTKNNER